VKEPRSKQYTRTKSGRSRRNTKKPSPVHKNTNGSVEKTRRECLRRGREGVVLEVVDVSRPYIRKEMTGRSGYSRKISKGRGGKGKNPF